MTVNSERLHYLSEKVVDMSKCRSQFSGVNNQTNLCIGGTAKHGTCKGDSGGPFQCYQPTTGRWYQMGLVSYGIPCALKDVPDVLTRIAYFHDWIRQQKD